MEELLGLPHKASSMSEQAVRLLAAVKVFAS
jgi:hypothetical protein